MGGLNVRLVLWFTAENIHCRPDSQTGMHQDPLGPPAPPTSWRIQFPLFHPPLSLLIPALPTPPCRLLPCQKAANIRAKHP